MGWWKNSSVRHSRAIIHASVAQNQTCPSSGISLLVNDTTIFPVIQGTNLHIFLISYLTIPPSNPMNGPPFFQESSKRVSSSPNPTSLPWIAMTISVLVFLPLPYPPPPAHGLRHCSSAFLRAWNVPPLFPSTAPLYPHVALRISNCSITGRMRLIRLALFDVGGPHPFTEGPSRTKRKQEEEFSPSLLMAWTEPWIFSCPWCSRGPGLQTRAEFQHPCPESPAPRKKTVGLLSLRKCIHPIDSLSLFNLTSTSVIRSCSILRVCALCLFFPRVPPHFLSG